jgi:hypothetical protein
MRGVYPCLPRKSPQAVSSLIEQVWQFLDEVSVSLERHMAKSNLVSGGEPRSSISGNGHPVQGW